VKIFIIEALLYSSFNVNIFSFLKSSAVLPYYIEASFPVDQFRQIILFAKQSISVIKAMKCLVSINRHEEAFSVIVLLCPSFLP